MFLSGADQQKAEGLRVPSLRGALRFWHRAVLGEELFTSEGTLRHALLFGDTSHGAALALRPEPSNYTPLTKGERMPQGCAYLGYGPIGFVRGEGMQTLRDAVDAGSEFRFRATIRSASGPLADDFLKALWLLSHLGGLGSRSRRGWGSVVVLNLRCTPPHELETALSWELPKDQKALVDGLQASMARVLASTMQDGAQSFTSLSRQTEIYILKTQRAGERQSGAWEACLEDIGKRFLKYRNYRFRNEKGVDDGTDTAEKDHDAVRKFLEEKAHALPCPPKRMALGLPYKMGFGSLRNRGDDIGVEAGFEVVYEQAIDRRASPVVIHCHELQGQNGCCAVVTYIRAPFLPNSARIQAVATRTERTNGTKKVVEVARSPSMTPPQDTAIVEFLKTYIRPSASQVTIR